MAFDNSLFENDAGYYQFYKHNYLPGKLVPDGLFTWSQKAVDAAVKVELDDSDVLIATYPKTGQTWTMTILRHIFQIEELQKGNDASLDDFFAKIPFMETEWSDGRLGADIFSNLPVPRFMKTHLPYQLWKEQLEKHPNLKVIQTLRNPKDTLVSYYHHIRSNRQLGGFNGTWDQFFEVFKEKKLPWGDFFELNVDWYNFNKVRDNSLILVYEEMKTDPKSHVLKIAKFIGHELSDKAADLIVQKSSIKKVSSKFNTMFKEFPSWNSERSNFVRKGEVGDWLNYFSKEQSDFIDAKCKEYLEPLGISFEYSI